MSDNSDGPMANRPIEDGFGDAAEELTLGGRSIDPGCRMELELRTARLPSGSWMTIPVVATRGTQPGPTVWLSAAIHGDEVCGVEIIRQALRYIKPETLRGTVLAVPVVNVPGFATGDRYMPDRRDLNRCFPGSPRGSLASRFAHLFMSEIVDRCSVGIDYHTGSDHRSNLPQIRADLDDDYTQELARVFAAPVTMHARLRDGSLREAAVRRGTTTLLYEGGEAWRFDDNAIDTGLEGTLRVLAHLDMIDIPDSVVTRQDTSISRSSRWLRSPMSGVARVLVQLGQSVEVSQPIAVISDAVGGHERYLLASAPSVVIGRNEQPVVHQGDALVHLATIMS